MDDVAGRIRPTLAAGERLLWVGTPDPDVLLTRTDAWLIPVSVAFVAFAGLWEWSVVHDARTPGFFPFFGGAFLLVGLYHAVGRFPVGRYLRRTTVYAITDRRAIVLGPRTMRAVRLADGNPERRWSAGHRRITVDFGFPAPVPGRWPMRRGRYPSISPLTGWDPLRVNPAPVVFDDVDDVAGLEAALVGTPAPGIVGR